MNLLGLRGEPTTGVDGRLYLHNIVAVQGTANGMVHLLLLGNDHGHGAECANSQCPFHGIVRVRDPEDSFHELVHVDDLVQVLLALLANAQNP